MSNLSLNTTICDAIDCGNTGMPTCSFKMGVIGGFDLLQKGKTFTKAETIAFGATLSALAANNSPALRCYPVRPITSYDRANTEAVYQTEGASKFFVGDGKIGWKFKMFESDLMYQKLRKFHNKQNSFDIQFNDITNNAKVGTVVSGVGMKGFALDQLSVQQMQATSSEVSHIEIEIVLKNIFEWENKAVVIFSSDIDVNEVTQGLIDYQIEVATPLVNTGLVVVKAKAGTQDLSPAYLSNLAQVTAWKATVDSDGTNIVIATVTQNTALGGWNVTCTLPSTSILPVGATFTLTGALPSVLAASPINMPGYSACGITLVRPA